MPACQNVATSLSISTPPSDQSRGPVPQYEGSQAAGAASQESPAHCGPSGNAGPRGPSRRHALSLEAFSPLLHQLATWSLRRVTGDWEPRSWEGAPAHRCPLGLWPCPLDTLQIPWQGPKSAGALSSVSPARLSPSHAPCRLWSQGKTRRVLWHQLLRLLECPSSSVRHASFSFGACQLCCEAFSQPLPSSLGPESPFWAGAPLAPWKTTTRDHLSRAHL